MMDLGTIKEITRKATGKAKRERKGPKVFNASDRLAMAQGDLRGPIPFLGDYVPKGWQVVETYFVDTSGFGRRGEPALSFEQLAELIARQPADHGWAQTEQGQFQGYVAEYETIESAKAREKAAQKVADHVDGYDRDDLGESPDH